MRDPPRCRDTTVRSYTVYFLCAWWLCLARLSVVAAAWGEQILEIFPRNFFGGLFLTAIALLRALGNKPEVAARRIVAQTIMERVESTPSWLLLSETPFYPFPRATATSLASARVELPSLHPPPLPHDFPQQLRRRDQGATWAGYLETICSFRHHWKLNLRGMWGE